jgi:hypothetical protein
VKGHRGATWRRGDRHCAVLPRNFFDTTVGAVSLQTLFAGTRRSHGRSNCKFDAALGLLNLWQKAKPVCRSVAAEALGWRRAAHVAQLVEHVLGKDEVTGSIPVMGSRTGSEPAAGN